MLTPYFAAEKWSAAADAHEVRVAESPGDTTAWIRLAVSARKSERFELALQALQSSGWRTWLRMDLRRLRSSGMTPYWADWRAMKRLTN